MQRRWEVLSQTLLGETGKYHTPRLTPRLLSKRYYARRAVIRETAPGMPHSVIQAYTALWPTDRKRKWYELGTVWVGEPLRGNGLRDELMAQAMALVPEETSFFLFTSSEAIMRSAGSLGFITATTHSYPDLLMWASDLGVVQRLPGSIHNRCDVPESGKRTLFILGSG